MDGDIVLGRSFKPRAVALTVVGASVASMVAPACRAVDVILVTPTIKVGLPGHSGIERLKVLAAGVNWDFQPDALTNAGLKKIGIKSMRLSNSDPVMAAHFAGQGQCRLRLAAFRSGQARRLAAGLATCRAVGASPNIVLGLIAPKQLWLPSSGASPGRRAEVIKSGSQWMYGPTNWRLYREYCRAFFKYVVIERKFPHAQFTVGNEPESGSGFLYPNWSRPAAGSRAAYEGYFKLYEEVARAAQSFEKKHPGRHVALGTGFVWAFTFRFGAFNWTERFLQDCGARELPLAFLGFHFYGNEASLDGQYHANYPPFIQMLRATQTARDRYDPSVPITCTEWGASYHTTNQPNGIYNGTNLGAAYGMAFLDSLLQCGIKQPALLLATTDPAEKAADGKWNDVWGWPSLFTDPVVFGRPYPKALYNVFEMIHRLVGTRIQASRGRMVHCLASADPRTKRLTVLLWNYHARLPEGDEPPVDYSACQAVVLRIRCPYRFFGAGTVRFKRWLVSRTVSNAYYLWKHAQLNEHRAALQEVDHGRFHIVAGQVDIGFSMPPSSVSLVEVYSAPDETQN